MNITLENKETIPVMEAMFGERLSAFLKDAWPNKHFFSDGEVTRFKFGEFNQIYSSPDGLLKEITGTVDVLGKDGYRKTYLNGDSAREDYHNNNVMVYLTDIDQYFEQLADCCQQLSEAFQIPRHYISCEGFLARKGVDVELHFDHETNFMIQLVGEKTWSLAPNKEIKNPLYAYFATNPNRNYEGGINPYTGLAMPTGIENEPVTNYVKPGTVTFLPRGYWHYTTTHSDSFSIGFVINPPTYAEIYTSALLHYLHQQSEFRAHPLGDLNKNQQHVVVLEKIIKASLDVAQSGGGGNVWRSYQEGHHRKGRPFPLYNR